MTPREYLSSLERFGIKLGLSQIRALLLSLDHPERACPTVVVAGTNGKGSVAAMLERGLRAGGLRTGRYTSPHLVSLEERFAVDGLAVDAGRLDAALQRVRLAADSLDVPPSFFEATTAAAFEIFREARVDISVLEVGLGGRLDATNVTSPLGVAITSVARDHEAQLGSSLESIAAEKAAVITRGAQVVVADNPPEVIAVVRAAAMAAGAPLCVATEGVTIDVTLEQGRTRLALSTPTRTYPPMTLALRGRHQVPNAVVAVRVLEALAAGGAVPVTADAVRCGLEEADWPGRLDLRRGPHGVDLLIDAAHNPAGAAALAGYLREALDHTVPIVIGALADKRVDEMIAALAGAASHFICTAPASPRTMPATEVARHAAAVAPHVPAEVADSSRDAIARASGLGSPVVVAGSLYLAGEILRDLP